MSRILFTLLALWMLVVVPSLCVAGTLEHLCADCPEETGCGHEEDCLDDPCAVLILSTGLRVVDWDPLLVPVPLVLWGADLALVSDRQILASLPLLPPLPRKQLPYPESCLPLLI